MEIIHFPHPTLRHQSKTIRKVDAELKKMVDAMFELMYEARGVGLAANQVDLPLRLFVVNIESDPEDGEELVFINPVISRPKGSEEAEEGCLSLPGVYGKVIRPSQVRIQAYQLNGEPIDATLDGLAARVVQHELDHLDGVMFIDRMKPGERSEIDGLLDEFETVYESQRGTGGIPDDKTIAQRLTEFEQRYC